MAILEIVQFKTQASLKDVLYYQRQIQKFAQRQPGFVRREVANDGEHWTDLVVWTDEASAAAAGEQFMQQAFAKPFMAMTEEGSVVMKKQHLHSLTSSAGIEVTLCARLSDCFSY
ncbi:hypothetical protein CHH28_17200 [Bacterioplanes sanyensis]|uniref:ABM domain-containing protein n=1 Tax=Bacterioplanes sanyensis TaxID=1249553 RepID=A0A222FMQ2_9GAMM|nr:hypothetical protein [Bacterioplanes sanyensis]ASP40307.1 hypothetical protein CHH28_17200 [Bacterioplanes sanyensis]